MKDKKHKIGYFLIFLFFIGLFAITSHYPFFWDTIQLASSHAHFFFETNFQSIILPNQIDSGHIPTLGIYLALLWKIFGKTLLVSHLAMLPFVLGIVYQSIMLCRMVFSKAWHVQAMIIILFDATLLAQCTLVSPDVMLVFFFLMGLNQFISKHKIFYSVALTGLVLSSMRGMMVVAGFFTAELIIRCVQAGIFTNMVSKKDKIKFLFSFRPFGNFNGIEIYIPATFIAGSFFAWHYLQTGWIGYHKGMPWAGLFEITDFAGFFKNIFLLGWRLTDFGRLFIWIAAIICAVDYLKHRPEPGKIFISFGILFLCLFIFLGQAVLLHKGLAGHRYLLPIYLLFALLVCYYLFEKFSLVKWKTPLFIFVIVGMLSGNFWVYPDKIAKGWDGTLAYLPYFHLRDKMISYMDANNIPYEETGSEFPNVSNFEITDLNESSNFFAKKDLALNRFVFYSNIYNDFSDSEIDQLFNNWIKLKEYRIMQVKVVLFKKP